MEDKLTPPLKRPRGRAKKTPATDTLNGTGNPADDVHEVTSESAPKVGIVKSSRNTTDIFSALDWSLGYDDGNPETHELLLDHLFPEIAPGIEVPRKRFASLIGFSFSLSFLEKKRVFDSMPTLSQFQVDALIDAMEDERKEFNKLIRSEHNVLFRLYLKAIAEWSVMLLGEPVGNGRTITFLKQALQNTKSSIPVKEFDRSKPYFWIAMFCTATFVGAGHDTLAACLIKLEELHDDDEDPAVFLIAHALFDRHFEPNWDKKSIRMRRAKALSDLLINSFSQSLNDTTPPRYIVLLARTLSLGLANDYAKLGETQKLRETLEKSLQLLEKITTTDESDNEDAGGEKSLADIYKVRKNADDRAAADTLKTTAARLFSLDVFAGNNPTQSLAWRQMSRDATKNIRFCDIMSYTSHGGLIQDILVEALKQREEKPKSLIIYASHLLAWSILTGNGGLKSDAAYVLFSLLDAELPSSLGTVDWDEDKRLLYAHLRVFDWLAPSALQEEKERTRVRMQVIFGEAFFSGERQEYPSKNEERNQTWFYRTIRALEEPGDPAQFARLERAIKDDEDRYDVLFWLYVYASVDTMRENCKRLSKMVFNIPRSRLEGTPLDSDLMARFAGLVKEDRYGGHPDDVENWKGTLRLVNGKVVDTAPPLIEPSPSVE